MIKMLKKNFYTISIIAVGLFVILGTTTLINTTSLKDRFNKNKISFQDLIGMKKGRFLIDSSSTVFNNLDGSKDFTDFEFKAPDFIPAGYEFSSANLNENNIISMDFEKDGEKPFTFMASKGDIMQEIKVITNKIAKSENRIIDFKEESMIIDNIVGNSITVNRKYKDLNYKNINIEKFLAVITTEKYFIWQDENIWYSIKYYVKDIISDSSSYIMEIYEDDLQKIASSIKYPTDI